MRMGTIVARQTNRIKTNEGIALVRRVTTVRMPNGRLRYPTDYYDDTPGAVKVSERERESLKVPGYPQFI